MKIKGSNQKTGEEYQAQTDKIDDSFIQYIRNTTLNDFELKKLLDKIDVSADAKVLLFSFTKVSIVVYEQTVKIGKKIIDLVFTISRDYPSTFFGIIFGAIVGLLISSIPILGIVLGPIFTPIAIAMGLVGGLVEDIKDKNLVRKIKEATATLEPLAA